MRRRGTNIFASIFSGLAESANGRVHWVRNMWALVDGPFDRGRQFNKNLIGSDRAPEGNLLTADKSAVLVKRRCCNNCPKPPVEGCYLGERGGSSVPASVCRKCPNHIPSQRRGARYACCALLRAAKPLDKVSSDFGKLLGEATAQVKQMIDCPKADQFSTRKKVS